jgi:hypothetical protein
MPFTWSQVISPNTLVERVDIQEIRNNADYLNNNRLYCGANYISYLTTHYGTHYGSNYSSYLTTHYTSNNAGYYGYYGGYNSSVS